MSPSLSKMLKPLPVALAAITVAATGTFVATTATTAVATPQPSANDADVALYNELNSIALKTSGEAWTGYAAESVVTERYVTDEEPWLEMVTTVGVQAANEANPQVAFDRQIKVDEEYADVMPFTSETWGSVGTGGYASGGATQGWNALPDADKVNSATNQLLTSWGNPERVVGRVLASSDTSPVSFPYSLSETREWTERMGVTPWGVILDNAQDYLVKIRSASKETVGNETVYTLVLDQEFSSGLYIEAVVQDGLVVWTKASAQFKGYDFGEPNVLVEQTSRMTHIGRKAPLPGPGATTTAVRAAPVARAAARDTVTRMFDKATVRLVDALKGRTATQQRIDEAVGILTDEHGRRWFLPADDDINMWTRKANVEYVNNVPALVASAHSMSAMYECHIPLAVKDGKFVGEMACKIVPLRVPGPDPVDEVVTESKTATMLTETNDRPAQKIRVAYGLHR